MPTILTSLGKHGTAFCGRCHGYLPLCGHYLGTVLGLASVSRATYAPVASVDNLLNPGSRTCPHTMRGVIANTSVELRMGSPSTRQCRRVFFCHDVVPVMTLPKHWAIPAANE